MQVVPFPSRQTRAHYRHELRTLTYVTLNDANPGVIRNLSSAGMRFQAVSPLRQKQRVGLRFNLNGPRVRVEADGEVVWADCAGQCGVRFIELPARTSRKIDEWTFSNLLEIAARRSDEHSVFVSGSLPTPREGDGLTLSSATRAPIRLDQRYSQSPDAQQNWLSRPLSARTVALAVDGLLVLAAILLFALIFLSITHELPSWPFTLGSVLVIALLMLAAYRSLFAAFGGGTLGARLMQVTSSAECKKRRAGVSD
ncbi:MAG: PilZ domain-containing protein [Candidatus Sulfotelmatobacter sp.]|jgi:hypothetical protein